MYKIHTTPVSPHDSSLIIRAELYSKKEIEKVTIAFLGMDLEANQNNANCLCATSQVALIAIVPCCGSNFWLKYVASHRLVCCVLLYTSHIYIFCPTCFCIDLFLISSLDPVYLVPISSHHNLFFTPAFMPHIFSVFLLLFPVPLWFALT